MQTIGILLPRSSYYTTMSFDMFEGLRAGLKQLGREDIRIITENIGFGAEKQECYRAAERLLMQENAQVVFAYIGHRTAQLLRPLFMAANKLLIVLDAGCNMPQEWPTSPNVFYHSLHNALGAWLSSEMAARDGYTKAGTATCFYDAGYLHTYASAKNWVNNGGEIVFNHATGYVPEEFLLQPLQEHLGAYPDACLLSLFSAEFAQWFYRDIDLYFSGKCPPVYAAPFAFEESMLAKTPYPGDHIRGIASWSKELNNPENHAFVQAVTDAGREATLFSLLGWEAATLAVNALELMSQNKNNAVLAGEKLKSLEFNSPRGKVHFHPATNHTLAPLFEATLEKDEAGNSRIKIVNEITNTEEAFESLSSEPLENAISGWFNSYTCI